MYRHEMTVEGKGCFPFDMLRYDLCFPITGDDAAAIRHSIEDREYKVTVATYTSNKTTAPSFTPARWASFGAVCSPITTRRSNR